VIFDQYIASSSPSSSPKSSPETGDTLLYLIRTNSRITTEEMGRVLGVSKRTGLKWFDNLKKQSRIRRI
jgi:predicted ArsR family transcriptional regulator